MLFMIEYEGMPMAYRVADSHETLLGFADYLKGLTGKRLRDLVLTFLDEEDDIIEIKDQFDYDYFLESCLFGSKVLKVRSHTRDEDLMNQSAPKKSASESIMNPSPEAQSNRMTLETITIEKEEIDLACEESMAPQLEPIKLPLNYSYEGLLNSRCLPDTSGPELKLANNSLTEKRNAGTQNVSRETDNDQTLLQVQQQIDSLQGLIFDHINQLSSSLQQIKSQKHDVPIRTSELTTSHTGYHCSTCKISPIIGSAISA